MNVFDEIRAELKALTNLELIEVAHESYGLDWVSEHDPIDIILDACLSVEQKNLFG